MRDKIRRRVVEALWHYLYPYQNRAIWKQMVLVMSIDDPWKRFGIPLPEPVPNRWELAMAVNRDELAIFGERVFEPLVKGVQSVDLGHRYIRQHARYISPGDSKVRIDIDKEPNWHLDLLIDTDRYPLTKPKSNDTLIDEAFLGK